MPAPLDFYTADMVRALNDAEPRNWPRYETVHGELLVSPAPRPRHQDVAFRLGRAIADYLDREPVGHVRLAPADISWGLPDVLVQPDVFVVPLDEARTLDWRTIRHLLLAIEVLSPGSIRADRFTKRRLYQELDVGLYWVIDGDAHTVEVWTAGDSLSRVEREMLVWHPEGAAGPFMVSFTELFRLI
ncbi:MAG TPA: Uma2 family endonuclease [Gemmatimonadaceae bacterium]|nr:Uma2 family endonuclease [Gemmatimonadaceae bacterium]